jgi:hypothetical protein
MSLTTQMTTYHQANPDGRIIMTGGYFHRPTPDSTGSAGICRSAHDANTRFPRSAAVTDDHRVQ